MTLCRVRTQRQQNGDSICDGMQEALNKYLELQPNGQFAEAAKGMLQMIGATIQTDYSNPNAKKGATKKK